MNRAWLLKEFRTRSQEESQPSARHGSHHPLWDTSRGGVPCKKMWPHTGFISYRSHYREANQCHFCLVLCVLLAGHLPSAA